MQIHRLRILLQMSARTTLHFHQAGELYALMAYVNGLASGAESSLPDGMLIDAPEQARLQVARDQEFAFGFTYLSGSPVEARGRIQRWIAALKEAGGTRGKPGAVFSNNFRVVRVEDLVAREPFDGSRAPVALPDGHIAEEIARLVASPDVASRGLTLRLTSPLRFHRPKRDQGTGHGFADETWFDPALLIDRADARQRSLGVTHHWSLETGSPAEASRTGPGVSANDLTWLDVSYGFARERKYLGGVLGSVTLTGLNAAQVERLVWGQYVHVGDNTRYGYGRYRIDELGPDPFPCPRSVGLVRLALSPAAIDTAAERCDAESGICAERARQIHRGVYQPDPCKKITISSGSRARTLTIPSRPDRALQRAVHDFLAPALDQWLEADSFAFRRGLGRHDAARRLKQSVAEGYRWALRADIDDFFESIDHRKLAARLRAYLADDSMSTLLLDWVRAGAPSADRGLPTGAVISPLLANLFLDRFDERITQAGGRLVRYADDFLILYRTESAARAAHELAMAAAQELALTLNADKTQLVNLAEPFTFVGFQFVRDSTWQAADLTAPRPVEQLGWFESGSREESSRVAISLPGESAAEGSADRATLILGPGVQWVGAQGHLLRYGYEEGRQGASIPLERLQEILIIGVPTLFDDFLRRLADHPIRVVLVDDWCRPRVCLGGPEEPGLAELIRAQVSVSGSPAQCLNVAQKLIAAKIRNYAVLADATPGRKQDRETGPALRDLAQRTSACPGLADLVGVEGAAAALWYSRLKDRLPSEFTFERRVAPRAADPVNILLNLAQTILHRLITALVSLAGLHTHLGCLHQPRSGHASLASDLQEPFRYLMDRAMLESICHLQRSDFVSSRPVTRRDEPTEDESAAQTCGLRLRSGAARRSLEQIHRVLALTVAAPGQQDRVSYRRQIVRTIRSFKQHLQKPDQPFDAFEHATLASPR